MDLATQYLASHLPMMVRPDSKDVFILGFGSGITGGAMLGHPVERINLAENCAPVLRAGKLFGPWNRDVLKDPRVRIWPEDARTVLKLNPQKYDIIISEPSNPWVVGVGSVFSQEYYQLAASKLKPGGIMAQWFHVYEMSDGIVALVLRTFGSVFRYIEIWDTNRGDLLLLGANEPWQMNGIAAVFDRKVPREDLEKIGIKSAEAIWARQLCSQRTAFAVPGQGPVQSDMFPVLEYEAPRAFYIGTRSRWLTGFDERTWQMPLATPAKRAALGALPDDMLKPVFEKHSTSNEDITGYLARRFGEAPADESEEKIGRTFVPCIFRPANRVPGDLNLPAAASENDKRWAQAWALLLSNPDQWAEGIRATEALLQNASGTSTPRDWPLADHAALAAKASLSLGDPQRARNFLALGSKFDPGHLQLRFLSDIMVREGVLQPTQIPN
jgi:hypothetical protein